MNTQYSLNRAAEGFGFLLLLDAYILQELVLEGSWSSDGIPSPTAGARQGLERAPGGRISAGMSGLCKGYEVGVGDGGEILDISISHLSLLFLLHHE